MKILSLTVGLVLVVIAAGFAVPYLSKRYLAPQTLEAAQKADDAGNEHKALKLFQEACSEGSDEACEAIVKNEISN